MAFPYINIDYLTLLTISCQIQGGRVHKFPQRSYTRSWGEHRYLPCRAPGRRSPIRKLVIPKTPQNLGIFLADCWTTLRILIMNQASKAIAISPCEAAQWSRTVVSSLTWLPLPDKVMARFRYEHINPSDRPCRLPSTIGIERSVGIHHEMDKPVAGRSIGSSISLRVSR